MTRPCLAPIPWIRRHVPGAKAQTYLRSNGKSNNKSRFPAGMTNKKSKGKNTFIRITAEGDEALPLQRVLSHDTLQMPATCRSLRYGAKAPALRLRSGSRGQFWCDSFFKHTILLHLLRDEDQLLIGCVPCFVSRRCGRIPIANRRGDGVGEIRCVESFSGEAECEAAVAIHQAVLGS